MISNHFQFFDYTERFYSYSTQDRFYEVLAKHSQLEKVLLTKHSLEMLRKQSKQYKQTVLGSLAGSILALYPFNKYISFGSGFLPLFGKLACNLAILCGPVFYANQVMRQRLLEVKKKAYD